MASPKPKCVVCWWLCGSPGVAGELVDGVDHLDSDEWFSYFSTVSMAEAAPTRSAATKIRALPKDKQNNKSMSIPHIHLNASSALPARVGEEW